MIGEFVDELGRARVGSPFSNGTEGDAWLGRWCETCRHDASLDADGGCVLVLASLNERTPAQWVPDRPGSLGHQYRCTEYQP